jgi:hypoxanthine phosphoribosyltransferase
MYQSFLIAGLASLRSFAVKLLGRYEIPFDGEMMNPVLRKSLTPLFKATSKIEDETGEAISIHVKSLSYADVQRGIGLLVADARQFGPDIILGINRGGAIVGGCIAKGLGLPWVYLLHVDCDRDLGGRVMENRLSESPLEGRVLLVDDAMRKGEHMREASEYILKKYSGVVLRRSVLLKMAVPHLGAERKTFRNESVDKAAFETENASLVLPWDVWGKER